MILKRILLFIPLLFSIFLGLGLGDALAGIVEFDSMDEMDITQSALPTTLYDIKGRVITEFFSDEKREIVPLDEIPEHLIYAILTREDRDFYSHTGYSIKGMLRAAFGYFTGNYQGGGSTLTIQVAGTRYANRREFTISRKLVELWYSILLEKKYAKNEILEFYLNEMPFGGGTNGVEAASKFYFKKSVREISVAESVLLVNLLSSHTKYSPFKNPEVARDRQAMILDEMVTLGYTTRGEADSSFQKYWNEDFDITRYATLGEIFNRKDKAPWFSEYIRTQLEDILLGTYDIYKDGLQVHTTLDLDYQQAAEEIMVPEIEKVDRNYRSQLAPRAQYVEGTLIPLSNMFSVLFNIPEIYSSGAGISKMKLDSYFVEQLNPVISLFAATFNQESLIEGTRISFEQQEEKKRRTQVEGALVCMDSHYGYIYAVVGGRDFHSGNQFNRALMGHLQPGSSFKPLYYSEAIESRVITAGTMLLDRPIVFTNDDGTLYTPLNYIGKFKGRVLVREALAHSMNIPSLEVLDKIGFDAAISRSSRLLGITDPLEIERIFPRKYPLGLGIISVSPLQMARAFATFANAGTMVEPIAIRYVEDKNGKIILSLEKDSLERRSRADARILSPQTAYIMTNILQSTVKYGTLAFAHWTAANFDKTFAYIEIAGKTGTTQNWSDGWAVGFTPYVTTAIWFGFDNPGNSLGRFQSGAVVAGRPWAEFMEKIHRDKKPARFEKPPEGIVEVTICDVSGKLPDPDGSCEGHTRAEVFLAGTQPSQYCDIHRKTAENQQMILEHMEAGFFGSKQLFDPAAYIDEQSKELFPVEGDGKKDTTSDTGKDNGGGNSDENLLLR